MLKFIKATSSSKSLATYNSTCPQMSLKINISNYSDNNCNEVVRNVVTPSKIKSKKSSHSHFAESKYLNSPDPSSLPVPIFHEDS